MGAPEDPEDIVVPAGAAAPWRLALGLAMLLAGGLAASALSGILGFMPGLPDADWDYGMDAFVLAATIMAGCLAAGRFRVTRDSAFLVLGLAFGGSVLAEIAARAAPWIADQIMVDLSTSPSAGDRFRDHVRALLASDLVQAMGLFLAILIMSRRFERLRRYCTPSRVILATAALVLAAFVYAGASRLGFLSPADDRGLVRALTVMAAIALELALAVHLILGTWRAHGSHLWLTFAMVFWIAEMAGIRPFLTEDRAAQQLLAADLAHGIGLALALIGLVVAVRQLLASAADSAARIRNIFRSVRDAVIIVDRAGRIESVNRAARAMFKIEPPDVIGAPIGMLLDHVDDAMLARPTDVGSTDIGPGDTSRGHGRRADGTVFPVETAVSAIDMHGEALRAVVVHDSTEHRALEAAQRGRSRELQEFLDAMSTLTAKLDTDGRVEACNQRAIEAGGLPLSFIRGRPVWAAPFFKDAPRHAVRLRRAIRQAAQGRESDYEEVILLRGRKPVHLRLVIKPVRDEGGGVKYILAEATDVSRLVHTEGAIREMRDKALKAAQVKSEFLAMMSHELRTPLNGVLGVASLLLETELSAEQKEYVCLIDNSAKGLLAILNDILDFSKVEAGQLEIVEEDFDLIPLIDGVVDLVTHQVRECGLDMGTVIPPDIPTALRGDSGRLRQVLLNLVSNAVKFTERGAISLDVRAEGETPESVVLHFEVTDTGIGIAREAQSRLFTRFSQIDSSSTRRFGGTGLGLAFSKKLVDLMGGSIGVESEAGRGSRFWFSLPFRKQEAKASPLAIPHLRGWLILIVDDHELDQRIFKTQIERLGARARAVASGAEGLAELHRAIAAGMPYDLVIVDHHMPEMDGFAFGQRMAADPTLAGMARLMISSGPLRGDTERALGLGFARLLAKPVPRRKLFEALNALARRETAGEPALTLQPPTPVAGVPASARAGPQEGAARRILIAEDNEVNQLLLLAYLKAGGYEADVAMNGREAVEAVRSRPYALVLMDIQMPVMDGLEATVAIRGLDSPVKNIPIIAATASIAPGERDHFLANGMDDFLPKPIRRDALLRMVEKWGGKGAGARRTAIG